MNKKAKFISIIIKMILDALVIYGTFLLAYWIRFNVSIVPVTKGVPDLDNYITAMPVVILIFLGTFKWAGIYSTAKGHIYKTDEFLKTVKAVGAAILLTVAATFVYREYSYSRLVIGYAAILTTIFIFSVHIFLRFLKEKILMPVASKLKILVIGGSKIKETFLKNTERFENVILEYIEEFDPEKVKKIIRDREIDEVIISRTDIDSELLLSLIQYCESRNVEFKMIPNLVELKMGELSFDEYFGLPVLKLKHPLFEPANYYTKRIFDIVATMMLLTFSAPFVILTVILIKIDSKGPVIYSHLRKGYKGRNFPFYKFRSMVQNADELLEDLMDQNERSGKAFKMKDDPRVTRVGKVIRKYSIDEIPQLFNVLRGDMSLVGPRPQVLWEARQYNDFEKRRLNILPGITGLWQVSGRADLTYEEMIQLDIYYLENWTLGFDFKILFKTIPAVVLQKGAS
ncbi:MAG: sugar transferase [Elusimicrobiota bacterium]